MDKYKIYPQSNSLTKIVADKVYWVGPVQTKTKKVSVEMAPERV